MENKTIESRDFSVPESHMSFWQKAKYYANIRANAVRMLDRLAAKILIRTHKKQLERLELHCMRKTSLVNGMWVVSFICDRYPYGLTTSPREAVNDRIPENCIS